MTTIYRAKRKTGRARRDGRLIAVLPAPESGYADVATQPIVIVPEPDAAIEPTADVRVILARAFEPTHEMTVRAERELRVAEAARTRAARALEYGLHPMTLDETERARLRAAYAAADAVVAERAGAVDRLRALGHAVKTIADALGRLDAEDHELADRLTATLALWQAASAREGLRPAFGG